MLDEEVHRPGTVAPALSLRVSGNPDDPHTRQLGEVRVLEVLRDSPWYEVPGGTVATGERGLKGCLRDLTLQRHLVAEG